MELFSSVSGILESGCRLLVDGILALSEYKSNVSASSKQYHMAPPGRTAEASAGFIRGTGVFYQPHGII